MFVSIGTGQGGRPAADKTPYPVLLDTPEPTQNVKGGICSDECKGKMLVLALALSHRLRLLREV